MAMCISADEKENGGKDMELKKVAVAGTLESSDAQVMIEPGGNGIELELTSSVMRQYGRQIRELVGETLERLDVHNCRINVNDHGALECTLKARVEAAVFRAAEAVDEIPWGGAVR